MKKIPKNLLSLLCIASLSACGGSDGGSSGQKASSQSSAPITSVPASSSPLSSSVTSSVAQSSSITTSSVSSPGNFTLVFRDDFNSFDSNRWQLMTHSWPGNIALFSANTVSVADGMMKLKILPSPAGTESGGEAKPYLGAEVRSTETITYGRISARAKLAKGSAVVSALVSIYTPWPADNWNEFDIESLGKDPREIQFNAMVYTGPKLTPPITASVTPTQRPSLQPLGFDSADDFHIYTIEWTPKEAVFLIDGKVYHRWDEHINLIGLPQNILLTIWVSNVTTWAGAITEDTIKAEAVYDWVEVWSYKP